MVDAQLGGHGRVLTNNGATDPGRQRSDPRGTECCSGAGTVMGDGYHQVAGQRTMNKGILQ